MATLCGLCFAPSDVAAGRLAKASLRHPGGPPREAIGCALAAYCHASWRSEKGVDPPLSVEARWLQLWGEVVKDDADVRGRSSGPLPLYLWMGTSMEGALREHHLAWHLHCLVVVHRTQEAMVKLVQCHAEGMLSRLQLPIVKELLLALPKETLDIEGGHTKIASMLAERLVESIRPLTGAQHRLLNASLAFSSRGSRVVSDVPIVTTDAVLYAHMIDYVLNTISMARSRPEYEARMSDLQTLFSLANTDSLAASLVPAGVPIESVMVATTDEHRSRRIGILGRSMRQTIKLLCGYSTIAHGTKIPVVWLQEPSLAVDRAIQLGVSFLSRLLVLCSSRGNGLVRRTAEPKWRRRLRATTAVRTHKYQLLLSELPHADLSVTVQTLLSGGFVCEGGELGWCLLNSEMVDLRFYSLFTLGLLYQALSALLKDTRAVPFAGKQRSGTHSHKIDEQSEGGNTTETEGSCKERYDAVLTQLRVLYTRRQEVFGEELLCFQPTTTHEAVHSLAESDHNLAEGKATHEQLPLKFLPGFPAPGRQSLAPSTFFESAPVVVDFVWKAQEYGSTHDVRVRHLVHCLRNRSMVTPEGKLVLDCRRHTFDGWELKGTATTTA
ncbi:unnamed protein product [Phytomonas sp. EM1]|nr:unnamed protein product [Phytomonas sp. EM1]|eukprot:CCW62055.1 unnamed protein product [Phytomonas sp. isolate EM1]